MSYWTGTVPRNRPRYSWGLSNVLGISWAGGCVLWLTGVMFSSVQSSFPVVHISLYAPLFSSVLQSPGCIILFTSAYPSYLCKSSPLPCLAIDFSILLAAVKFSSVISNIGS